MTFESLDILPCYESGVNDIIEDFYTPILSCAVKYDRIAGFFSSSALAVAARGLSEFIQNGGKMRLITSPILDPGDIEIMSRIVKGQISSIEDFGINLENLQNEFLVHHVKALGWMISQGLLEIRLAIVTGDDGALISKESVLSSGLFHQKVGILTDKSGNRISFSGSINETAAAWINNDEEFKVFKEWDAGKYYFEKDIARFDDLWNGKKKNVKIFDLPSAVKKDLVNYSKSFDPSSISLKSYIAHKKKENPFEYCGISLFSYQKQALKKWKSVGYKMLFEMATGTGKTRTAIAGLKCLSDSHDRLITIIACPQNTLARQWMDEVEKLGVIANWSGIIDGTNHSWLDDLETALLKNSAGLADHLIIYTTHNTAASDKFIQAIETCRNDNTDILFIGDEVHWLGASKLRKALLPTYKYRIGLSATPSRWFDDNGTRLLDNYFGNNHFEFTIKDALTKFNPITQKHFLVNYYYKISTVHLTLEETLEYQQLTDRIVKLYQLKDTDSDAEERYNRLLEKRADIIKNAKNKFSSFEKILDELQKKDELENLIVFVSPQQRENVLEILRSRNIISHQLTQEEGTKLEKRFGGLSERQHIIRLFKQGFYKVLVAIKCLDEGIDIPSASRGILLASSTNPREYVQRIGRIIRQDENKSFAYLFDICVDSIDSLCDEAIEIEKKIRRNEQKRLQEIAANAINSAEALSKIFNLD